VATVDATGLATATGNGTTTITATAGSLAGSATLTVDLTTTIATIDVAPSSATLTAVGATQQFTAVARDASGMILPGIVFAWASAATEVASIDQAGVATALGHGTTIISATAGGVTGTATLAVELVETIARVVVTPEAATLNAVNATEQFTAVAYDANDQVVPGVPFTWTSTAPAVATVDATGLATATGNGTTTITATAGSLAGSATLTVDLAATIATVVVTPSYVVLPAVGATQAFTATAFDANGAVVPGVSFTWSTVYAGVAVVDSVTGVATALSHGNQIVRATVAGVTGEAALTVDLKPLVVSVEVVPVTTTLTAVGQTLRFTCVARDRNGTELPGVPCTWVSTDTTVATVEMQTGLATAAGPGTTTIVATTYIMSGSATLTVDLTAGIKAADAKTPRGR
jgi:hypothetical protein